MTRIRSTALLCYNDIVNALNLDDERLTLAFYTDIVIPTDVSV